MNYTFFVFLVAYFYVAVFSKPALADCDHWWLDQYKDVLPSINNRPEFPVKLSNAFEVGTFDKPIKWVYWMISNTLKSHPLTKITYCKTDH